MLKKSDHPFYKYFKEVKGTNKKMLELLADATILKIKDSKDDIIVNYFKGLDEVIAKPCNCELIDSVMQFTSLIESCVTKNCKEKYDYCTALLWYIAKHPNNTAYKLIPYVSTIKIGKEAMHVLGYQLYDNDMPIISLIDDDRWYIIEEFHRVQEGGDNVSTSMLCDTSLEDMFILL